MARGNNNNRGRGRGFRGEPRGRSGRGWGRGSGRGRGRGRGGGHDFTDELDFVVQKWPDHSASGGYESPRFRGRGRGGPFSHPNSGSTTPNRGRESPSARGRGTHMTPGGRGRGLGGSKLRPDAPLSRLLYQERPLLRPVIFVRSVHTRTLFEEEEEILQAVVEDVDDGEQNHVPTADRVNRVFSGSNIPWMDRPTSEDDHPSHDTEELEEIDFGDMGRLREEIDAAALKAPTLKPKPAFAEVAAVEEKFTGCFIDANPTSTTLPSSQIPDNPVTIDDTHNEAPLVSVPNGKVEETELALPPNPVVEEGFSDFYIDTNPTLPTQSSNDVPIVIDRTEGMAPLGDNIMAQEQEEIIVYVAPHPRSGKIIPAPEPPIPPLPSISTLTTNIQNIAPSTPPAQPHPSIPSPPSFESVSFSFANSSISRKQPHQVPVFSPRDKAKAKVKARRKETRAARTRMQRKVVFGSFGAIMSEAQLRGDEAGKWKRDPRWEERRQDDSDVDWGDEDEDKDGVDESSVLALISGADGMDLDPELDLDVKALKTFVKGMNADGARFVTMDDIADAERMRLEDEEGGVSGSSEDDEDEDEASSVDEEADDAVCEEEEMMVAEPRGVDLSAEDESDDDEESSEDENESPRTGFQARLALLRRNAQGKRPANATHVFSEDENLSDDDDFFQERTWAEEDDDFIANVEALLDENDQILTGHDRKERNRLFRAVHNGAFDDMEGISPAKRRKGKDQAIPPELREQWQKDRDKKAENKRARALARFQLAADPLFIKKGGKKGIKTMFAVAKLNPTIRVLPNRIIDVATLEQQIRRFLSDLGGPSSMSLPPTDKATRKSVHELATAFNLKSLSKGKEGARYTTLTKTTRSGVGVNEKKVARIVRRSRGGEFVGPFEGREKNKAVVPRHKDGEEVGKAAPKIGESNIGFRMLASMGWAEGDRIGVSGGLHVPLTAVIKNTKSGLGANR